MLEFGVQMGFRVMIGLLLEMVQSVVLNFIETLGGILGRDNVDTISGTVGNDLSDQNFVVIVLFLGMEILCRGSGC